MERNDITIIFSVQYFLCMKENSVGRDENKEVLTFQCAVHLKSSTATGRQKGSSV